MTVDHRPVVLGWCPGCGASDSLRLESGIVQCIEPGCPEPEAVSDLLDPPEEQHIKDHLVRLDHNEVTVQHPLAERIDGDLFSCQVYAKIIEAGRSPLPDGTYAVQATDMDDHPNDWTWERIR